MSQSEAVFTVMKRNKFSFQRSMARAAELGSCGDRAVKPRLSVQ
jgi:hypothetical protein